MPVCNISINISVVNAVNVQWSWMWFMANNWWLNNTQNMMEYITFSYTYVNCGYRRKFLLFHAYYRYNIKQTCCFCSTTSLFLSLFLTLGFIWEIECITNLCCGVEILLIAYPIHCTALPHSTRPYVIPSVRMMQALFLLPSLPWMAVKMIWLSAFSHQMD